MAAGETPFMETAETLKHTNDLTNVEYDGQTAGESVRDFPQETGVTATTMVPPGSHVILDNQSIFNT